MNSRNSPPGLSAGSGRPVLMMAGQGSGMKIIEAIQEAYGPEFTTLEDAIHWWSGPRAWREDFTAVLILRSGKRPYKQHLSEVQFDDDEH